MNGEIKIASTPQNGEIEAVATNASRLMAMTFATDLCCHLLKIARTTVADIKNIAGDD